MIVGMKHLTVLCTGDARDATLESLRDLGVLHVTAETEAAGGDGLAKAEAALASAKKALEIAGEQPVAAGAAAGADSLSPEEVLDRKSAVDALAQEVAAMEKDVALYSPFGTFDPADAKALASRGIGVSLFRAPMGTALPSGGIAICLDTGNARGRCAQVAQDGFPQGPDRKRRRDPVSSGQTDCLGR